MFITAKMYRRFFMDLIMDQPQFRFFINTEHFISYATSSYNRPNYIYQCGFRATNSDRHTSSFGHHAAERSTPVPFSRRRRWLFQVTVFVAKDDVSLTGNRRTAGQQRQRRDIEGKISCSLPRKTSAEILTSPSAWVAASR